MENKHICYTQGDDCTLLKILDRFGWFVTVDEKWNVMPHIYAADGEQYRINYCPSCGQNIRDIIIPASDVNKEEK